MTKASPMAEFALEQAAFRAFLSRREAALSRPLDPDELYVSRREFVTLPRELITLLADDAASEAETSPTTARHPGRDFVLACTGTVFTVVVFVVAQFATGHPVLASVTTGCGLTLLAMLILARRRHAGVRRSHAEAGRGG